MTNKITKSQNWEIAEQEKNSSDSLIFLLPFVKSWDFLPVTIILFHMIYTDGTAMGATETSFIFHSRAGESLII